MNIKGEERPEYFVVPSTMVARIVKVNNAKTGGVFYEVHRKDMLDYSDAWTKVFGISTPVDEEAEAS